MIVHRLDMATSGLLLVAKTKEVHQHLQEQFISRSIKKRYVALLDRNGLNQQLEETGTINLPLCLNPLNHPGKWSVKNTANRQLPNTGF